MASLTSDSITELLQAARAGDDEAYDVVFKQTYAQLHRLAHLVRQGKAGDTLSTTALVHEAYFKLMPSKGVDWQDRTHFLRVAARAMRQVLVAAARHRMRVKRGGGALTVVFDEQVHPGIARPEALLALDEALARLEQLDERQARIIECRFFAGLNVEETALALGISTPTVKRDWRAARAWLARELDAS